MSKSSSPNRNTTHTKNVEVHLYGKLRRAGGDENPAQDCVVYINANARDTALEVTSRLGFTEHDLGLVFINGQLADLSAPVRPGDRLGLFPSDQRLLYKWYFPKVQGHK